MQDPKKKKKTIFIYSLRNPCGKHGKKAENCLHFASGKTSPLNPGNEAAHTHLGRPEVGTSRLVLAACRTPLLCTVAAAEVDLETDATLLKLLLSLCRQSLPVWVLLNFTANSIKFEMFSSGCRSCCQAEPASGVFICCLG